MIAILHPGTVLLYRQHNSLKNEEKSITKGLTFKLCLVYERAPKRRATAD
jgi:hypothetical protein